VQKNIIGVYEKPFVGIIDDFPVDNRHPELGASLFAADKIVFPDIVALLVGVILHPFLTFLGLLRHQVGIVSFFVRRRPFA